MSIWFYFFIWPAKPHVVAPLPNPVASLPPTPSWLSNFLQWPPFLPNYFLKIKKKFCFLFSLLGTLITWISHGWDLPVLWILAQMSPLKEVFSGHCIWSLLPQLLFNYCYFIFKVIITLWNYLVCMLTWFSLAFCQLELKLFKTRLSYSLQYSQWLALREELTVY